MKTIRRQNYILQLLWVFMISLGLTLSGCQWGSDAPPPDTKIQAITKIKAYADSNGTTEEPNVEDYADAGVTGVTVTNLADMNQVIENLTQTEVDSTQKLQALADALGADTETDMTAPKFTSPESVSVLENQTDAIILVATDSSGVTYSISDGNASSFVLDSATGVVTFRTPPDFESGNILYIFTAIATDGSAAHNSTSQQVTIHVTDVNENGGINGEWVSEVNQRIVIDTESGTWKTYATLDSEEPIVDHIVSYNADQMIYKNNHGVAEYGRRHFSGIGGSFFYMCDFVFDAKTEQEAAEAHPNPKVYNSNLIDGCGGFPWMKLTRI